MITDAIRATIKQIAAAVKSTGKKYVILHYIGANADTSGAAVTRFHKVIKGWSRDGYHYFLNHDGTFEQLEPVWARVNGCARTGFINRIWRPELDNEKYIGVNAFQIVFETLKDLKMSDTQNEVLIELFREIIKLNPDIQIGGHREFPDLTAWNKRQQTACPGFSVSDWLLKHAIPRKNIFYESWRPS